MALSPGSKLGPYEVQSPLGAGGMGEVYRAKDTRLDRSVAIKILPAHLSSDPVRKQRFEREARTISSLNHPNICSLYDVGSQDGIEYLVLEYVEGETLEKRLEKGPLPTDVLLRHAMEIADALEKAHRSGVIHRDLKPANIMLTKSGAKLLDFGLAKWSAGSASEEETLKTLTAGGTKLTEQGTILGTFQYMAPEQLEGKEADTRTDLFAFGEVLYEMATGRPAFVGKTKASLIAAILSAEPTPISTLQPMTPPALERLVRGCLVKDPDERWQTAHDMKLQLRAIAEGGSQSGVPAPVAAQRKKRERLLLAALSVTTLAAALLGVLYVKRAPEQARIIRASIKPAANASFNSGGRTAAFAISPDGRRLAYVAFAPDGQPLLWVRSIDSMQAQRLAGTEGAGHPFWSPDNRFIGFFASGKLKKVEASGGAPLILCEASLGRGATWNQEGVILFAPGNGGPIYRVPAAGGEATQVTTLKNEQSHRWPYFLPDGRHFLYLAGSPYSARDNPTNEIRVGSLDSKESTLLFRTVSNAIYASGHILFLRQNTLMAQPFNAKRLELTGEAFSIADQVQENPARMVGIFSASDNGVLAYTEGTGRLEQQLIWVDRSGKKLGEVRAADDYSEPRISPDGKRLTFTLQSAIRDIWIEDISRAVKTRLTFGSASTQSESPVWSPDGHWVAYSSFRGGRYGFYEKQADGSGNEEVLLEAKEEARYASDWSPDGKYLAYYEVKQGIWSVWMLPVFGDRKPYAFLQSPFNLIHPRFSPDGKWVAYCSTESGRFEVYVVPFPGPGGKRQISTGGGCQPTWRRDAKEIFYLASDNKLMAGEVKTSGSSFEVGTVKPLFENRPFSGTGRNYDAAADGQRFVVNYSPEQPNAAITLVVNWDAELKKK